MNTNKKILKNPKIFNCENCNYLTSSLKDYTKHCSTQKHTRLTNANDLSQKIPQKNVSFSCICGNVYKHMSSLCKHKKKCCDKINTINEDTYQDIHIKDKDALVLHLLKQNGELQNKIIE